MWEGGRDLEGTEPVVEYCDRRFLEACDIGRGRLLLRAGGDVTSGGSAGCVVLTAGGEVAGEEAGDMTAVMASRKTNCWRAGWGLALAHLARFRTADGTPSTPARLPLQGRTEESPDMPVTLDPRG